ncbi:glycoside hydrolase family 16 protein [Nocardioides sp. SYSU D00038]|uniref:glycoside hydrolase family 16 protein n=1 Tax=Nocardioides sp. SYSU D00038 TaxID=2812554 RepID=UPI001966EB79|nr:glycoside hydrolase family 16 protein [Nocardioides sp. SYSU D00038]
MDSPRTLLRRVAVALVLPAPLLLPVAAGDPAPADAAPGVAAAAPQAADACGTRRTKANGVAWRCSFSDDFSGSSLDRDKWAVTTTAETGYRLADECFVDDRTTVAVSGGKLRLTARRLPTARTCTDPVSGNFATRWTAGMVHTRGQFSQSYGLYEIRARFPAIQQPGLHSALWFYPEKFWYGPGASGEIDLVEHYSFMPRRVIPSLLYRPATPVQQSGPGCFIDSLLTFHTYQLEWTPTRMTMTYDGKPCWSTSWTPAAPLTAPAPFDRPFVTVLTQGLGSGVNAPGPYLPGVATMEVEYVRAWH